MHLNRFLEGLPSDARALIGPRLTEHNVFHGKVIARPGAAISDVWFPTTALLNLATVMRNGRRVQTGMVGAEGGYGLINALGSALCNEEVSVLVGGHAYSAPTSVVWRACLACPETISHLFAAQTFYLAEISRTSACNCLHTTQQRLCRLLLAVRDRLEVDVLPLAQDDLAQMLGVQRTTVTTIAAELRDQGIITYRRGKLQITDFRACVAVACECYVPLRGDLASSDAARSGEARHQSPSHAIRPCPLLAG